MIKKRYLFLIILACLFAISAASAEDNSTSDIVSVSNDINSLEVNILESNMNSIANDTNTLKVSNDELVAAGNNLYVNASKTSSGNGTSDAEAFISLGEAIDSASDGDTIMIASGTYAGENNTNLTFSKNLNFIKYGDGEAIFDAQKLSRIWTVAATSINITGLTFKNGRSDYGGAIRFTNNVFNSNIDCSFVHDTVTDNGGAIYFDNNVTNSNISGDFIENVATRNGGAIYVNGVTRACSIAGNFTDNTSPYGGAIVFHTIVDSTISGNFINNIAEYGGAIYFTSVTNCNISGNFVRNMASNGDGGAIFFANDVSNSNINGSFEHNIASNNGDNIYFSKNVTNCNILGNFVKNIANIDDDGAISNDLINNLPDYGGAIVFYVMVDYRPSNFLDTMKDCGLLILTAISRLFIGW